MKWLNSVLIASVVGNTVQSMSWTECIESKKEVILSHAYTLIKRQAEAYAKGKAPTIAHALIKDIPFEECGEPLVNITACNNPRISMLPYAENPFFSPYYNAGFKASSYVRLGLFNALEKMIYALDLLAPSFGYCARTLTIKVFEGLRDRSTQKQLFDEQCQKIGSINSEWSQDQIFNEAVRWVSPVQDNVPVHSTGAAIDIRLWNDDQCSFIDMGTFGVMWEKNETAPTFCEDLTDIQKNNRLYLLAAATQAGLVNYVYEWWHVSLGDRYAAYWQGISTARYDAVDKIEEGDVERSMLS